MDSKLIVSVNWGFMHNEHLESMESQKKSMKTLESIKEIWKPFKTPNENNKQLNENDGIEKGIEN